MTGVSLDTISIDVWFEIAILTDKYQTYLNLAVLIPKLKTKTRLLRARKLLTKRTTTQFYEEWTLDGKFHREETDENGQILPAIIYASGDSWWYQDGLRHRESYDDRGKLLPAWVDSHGKLEWWIEGVEIVK
jgi:hypothetical protein